MTNRKAKCRPSRRKTITLAPDPIEVGSADHGPPKRLMVQRDVVLSPSEIARANAVLGVSPAQVAEGLKARLVAAQTDLRRRFNLPSTARALPADLSVGLARCGFATEDVIMRSDPRVGRRRQAQTALDRLEGSGKLSQPQAHAGRAYADAFFAQFMFGGSSFAAPRVDSGRKVGDAEVLRLDAVQGYVRLQGFVPVASRDVVDHVCIGDLDLRSGFCRDGRAAGKALDLLSSGLERLAQQLASGKKFTDQC